VLLIPTISACSAHHYNQGSAIFLIGMHDRREIGEGPCIPPNNTSPSRESTRVHLCFAFLSRLRPSLARRFAVRLSAATLAAFLARAVRSSGVIFWAAVFPPCLPNLRAISAIAARTSAGILVPMLSMIQLTGYAGRD
jgi:hypothetical protein